MRYSSKLINPQEGLMGNPDLQPVRDLQVASEVEDSLVGLSPELVEPDAISR